MEDSDERAGIEELRVELDRVDANLVIANRQLDELRKERSDPDALPDTSDDAITIRELEDQEAIVSDLESRRRSLMEQLR